MPLEERNVIQRILCHTDNTIRHTQDTMAYLLPKAHFHTQCNRKYTELYDMLFQTC